MIASLAIISATPPTPSASPLALSDVALHGDFADRQSRDRDVLLSLNATRWACHFTTTANLTSWLRSGRRDEQLREMLGRAAAAADDDTMPRVRDRNRSHARRAVP